jgi:hypothetical protein
MEESRFVSITGHMRGGIEFSFSPPDVTVSNVKLLAQT